MNWLLIIAPVAVVQDTYHIYQSYRVYFHHRNQQRFFLSEVTFLLLPSPVHLKVFPPEDLFSDAV